MIIMRAGKRSRGSGLPETSTTVDPSKAGPVLGGSLHARMNASCSCRRMRSVCFLMAFYIHSRAFARGGCFLLMLTNPAVRLFCETLLHFSVEACCEFRKIFFAVGASLVA